MSERRSAACYAFVALREWYANLSSMGSRRRSELTLFQETIILSPHENSCGDKNQDFEASC